jgi:predicted nucleic acid-binding protein
VVIDASVWVSYFVPSDPHHEESFKWVAKQLAEASPLVLPGLSLADVGGAISRISGDPETGKAAVRWLLARPGLEVVSGEDQEVAAAFMACELLLRGADAHYVLLAHRRSLPLISWDEQQLVRSAEVTPVGRPGEPLRWPGANR